jgi:hypothetical protein
MKRNRINIKLGKQSEPNPFFASKDLADVADSLVFVIFLFLVLAGWLSW